MDPKMTERFGRRRGGAVRFVALSAVAGLTACSGADGFGESSQPNGDIETEQPGSDQEGLVGTSTPVTLWKMDDCSGTTITDSSKTPHNGSKNSGVTCATNAMINNAASFNGTSGVITVPDNSAFRFTTAMSASAWVKPSDTTGTRNIVSKWYTGGNSYRLSIQNGSFVFSVAVPGGAVTSVSTGASVNKWSNVVGTFNWSSTSNTGTLTIWVNGQKKATATTGTTTTGLQASTAPVQIGGGAGVDFFKGQIDEVRFYKTALVTSAPWLYREVWPNDVSKANSDPWIAQNHENIRILKPKILALNFVNADDMPTMTSRVAAIVNSVNESSRYHGYRDASADKMVQYGVYKSVDLRDAVPPANWPYENSTKYPREDPRVDYFTFDYGALFNQTYAGYYGIKAADGHNMDLCELFKTGTIHELWLYGAADNPNEVKGAEFMSIHPYYDANRVRVPGKLSYCGHECLEQEDIDSLPPSCGIADGTTPTIRIGWINHNREVAAYLESLNHNIEDVSGFSKDPSNSTIPYWTQYAIPFFDGNLDTRYAAPFPNWYACLAGQTCITHRAPSPSTVIDYDTHQGQTGTIANYRPVCGTAHMPPNARQQYDYGSDNLDSVNSTCEHFQNFDNAGADKVEVFSSSKFVNYDAGWQVYLRQSFPGYGWTNGGTSNADFKGAWTTSAKTTRVLAWWPFLFY